MLTFSKLAGVHRWSVSGQHLVSPSLISYLQCINGREGLLCCEGEFDSKGRGELIASFVLAYHQSEGGPWTLTPGRWLDSSVRRNFLSYIKARNAGTGEAPQWHIVRHLLKVKAACHETLQQPGRCPVLGQQAAMMFGGQFDETLQLPSTRDHQPKKVVTSALASTPWDPASAAGLKLPTGGCFSLDKAGCKQMNRAEGP